MNQFLASVLALSFLTYGVAQASCLGESQIIAQVTEARGVTSSRCLVTVAAKDLQFYSENQLCPLSVDEVLVKGILVRADNFQCVVGANSTISGILVLQENGSIILE